MAITGVRKNVLLDLNNTFSPNAEDVKPSAKNSVQITNALLFQIKKSALNEFAAAVETTSSIYSKKSLAVKK